MWRLMILGRSALERLQFLAELFAQTPRSRAHTPTQSELEWLLDIGDSTITYRTRYLASPLLGSTIDLLVFDKTNPRALAFQWHAIAAFVGAGRGLARRHSGRSASMKRWSRVEEMELSCHRRRQRRARHAGAGQARSSS